MNVDFFMKEAIIEADKAYNLNEVPVGGILVDNTTNKIVGRSYNTINKNKNASKINPYMKYPVENRAEYIHIHPNNIHKIPFGTIHSSFSSSILISFLIIFHPGPPGFVFL